MHRTMRFVRWLPKYLETRLFVASGKVDATSSRQRTRFPIIGPLWNRLHSRAHTSAARRVYKIVN